MTLILIDWLVLLIDQSHFYYYMNMHDLPLFSGLLGYSKLDFSSWRDILGWQAPLLVGLSVGKLGNSINLLN